MKLIAILAATSILASPVFADSNRLDRLEDRINVVDTEDQRLTDGSVNGTDLVLYTEDMDGDSRRPVVVDLSSIAGQNGKDGKDGANGANGTSGANGTNGKNGTNGSNGFDGMSGLSLVAAASSFSGDGIGFGLSHNGSDLEFSIAGAAEFENNVSVFAGITYDDRNGNTTGSIGIGYSF